jgi:hypothetical protein
MEDVTMRKSLIVNVIVASIVAHSAVTFAGTTKTITEDFSTMVIDDYGVPSEHTLITDTVVENLGDGVTDKTYYQHHIEGSTATLQVKQMNLHMAPFTSDGLLYVGSSDLFATNVSKYYQVAGLRYELDKLYNTIDIEFGYYNTTNTNGSLALVAQQVDDNGNVLWEKVLLMTGYKSYINDWQHIHFTADRMETLVVQGREFNVLWVVAMGHTIQAPLGGKMDSLSITLTSPYEEEVVVEVVEEEPVVMALSVEAPVVEVVEEEVVPQPAEESDCGCKCNKFAKQIAKAKEKALTHKKRGQGFTNKARKFERKQARWCAKHNRR